MVAAKVLYDKNLRAATDLLAFIETDDSWIWARGPLSSPLITAIDAIQKIRNSSALWKGWTMETDFPKWIKKNHYDANLQALVTTELPQFQKLPDKIIGCVGSSKRMHSSSTQMGSPVKEWIRLRFKVGMPFAILWSVGGGMACLLRSVGGGTAAAILVQSWH